MANLISVMTQLEAIGNTLVASGYFNKFYVAPVDTNDYRKVLVLDFEDVDETRIRPLDNQWEATFRWEIRITQPLGNENALVGTVSDPGLLILEETLKETCENNLRNYPGIAGSPQWGRRRKLDRQEHPKYVLEVPMTLRGWVNSTARQIGQGSTVIVASAFTPGFVPFNFQALTSTPTTLNTGDFWLLDSGGSRYLCYRSNGFSSYLLMTSGSV